MVAADSLKRVTLAELVATLSLVSDLGMGRPIERVLRQTVVAMRLGAAAGMDQAACASAYYTSLLTWVGCAVDTSELAALFGDEIGLYADTRDEDLERVTLAVFVARHLGRGQSGFRRIGMVGKFLATAGRSVQRVMESHCQAASDLADGWGWARAVCEPLLQAFERWDGKGVPGRSAPMGWLRPSGWSTWRTAIEAFHHAGGAGPRCKWPGAAGHAVRPGPGGLLLRPARRDPRRARRHLGVGGGDRARPGAGRGA